MADGPSAEVDRGGYRPARGYSWPPFEPGNLAALRHGARSERMVRPIADRLAAELATAAPWATQPAFAAEVQAWAWAEARCVLLRAWLDEHGLLDDEGEPRPAAGELARAEASASKARANLGLSPRAWAQLRAAMAAGDHGDDGLAALEAVGRAMAQAEHDDDEEADDAGS